MGTWDDNIKMGIKGTGFIFRLHSSLQHGEGGLFGKGNEVILYKNNKYTKKFYSLVF